jgi:nucleotide-binding universal stress UspA family protein
MDLVVVGVDVSKSADRALEFAANEAALRGLSLRVVSVWAIPAMDGLGMANVGVIAEGLAQEAHRAVRRAVERAESLEPSVRCESRVIEGSPADVLVSESQGATLLVLGHRARRGFTWLATGSVSLHVLQRAPCPVVVVGCSESSRAD